MLNLIKKFQKSLVAKLIVLVGLVLLICLSGWAYFSINYQKKKVMVSILSDADGLANTIKMGTHYAMMHNLRDDITLIIKKFASERKLESLRIYNKEARIKYSNANSEVDQATNIKAEACNNCHQSDPPQTHLSLPKRTRIFFSPDGHRLLGIISPIYSEPGCSSNMCHVHPPGKKVLGALDVVVSLAGVDKELARFQNLMLAFGLSVFLITASIIFFFLHRFVKRPIKKMIAETDFIANGRYSSNLAIDQDDEIGRLTLAIKKMGEKIGEKQAELNKQRDEYQTLFELVPCIITVQDRNYELLQYNRDFYEKFNPKPGDHCYRAYKGRELKCEICPVEETFEDGLPHFSEERGFNKDGTPTHWIVRTSPIKNEHGEIVAAMEMSVDVTQRKLLEEELKKSEKKYYAIFDNIPNPVFVLDMNTLEILDCNHSVKAVYGYDKDEIIRSSFLNFFKEKDGQRFASLIKTSTVINRAQHINKAGQTLFVNLRISPSEYPGGSVLLVTTSDITRRLETEQQLIQASKMATLGEMATGVAHELNQPLSVIKTASRFFMKKIKKKEKIEDEIFLTMSTEIDSYVDRAAKIINHMRQFGRKSDIGMQKVLVNEPLQKAMEILGQQLKVRGIEVAWNLEENIPMIMADPGRLEQVFINLLINARDAVDEKWQSQDHPQGEKIITIKTESAGNEIVVEISDTGPGIPDEIIDRIFEPFFTSKKVGQGTGLGLSISYGIIQECNGSIKAFSKKNEGTRFRMRFPVADDT
jgi:histidine kinase